MITIIFTGFNKDKDSASQKKLELQYLEDDHLDNKKPISNKKYYNFLNEFNLIY